MDFKPVGSNVYVYNQSIFASKKGKVVFLDGTVEVITRDEESRITSADFHDPADDASMHSDQATKVLVPKEGCEVYARVDRVEDRFCRVKILAIDEQPLPAQTHFTAMLFRENVRDYDRDNLVMQKCFVPNDIIKARVI